MAVNSGYDWDWNPAGYFRHYLGVEVTGALGDRG
jgi:hypothetical protein